MKKILAILAISGLSVAAFAQGTVSWGASGSSLVVETNGSAYSPYSAVQGSTGRGSTGVTLGNNAANTTALGYQGYYYELLVSTTATAAPTSLGGFSAWKDTTLQATNGALGNGRIVENGYGGAGGVSGNTQATAANWPAGVTENILLVGWSANLGNTWATALADAQNASYLGGLASWGYFGVSSVGALASGSGNPGVSVFGIGAGQIYNPVTAPLYLQPLGVPEPGTLALAALGGASLLLFRRKK